MQIVKGMALQPWYRREHPIYAFHGRPAPLIAPGIQPSGQVDLGKLQSVNGATEALHETTVQSSIVLVLRLVD